MHFSKLSLLPAALLYSAASADIWIGTASGQYQCGSSGSGPQQCPVAEWVLMIGEEPGDVCDSKIGAQPDGFPHLVNELSLGPDTWDLCGISLCGSGHDVVMGKEGNCGKDGYDEVPDGTHYAPLYDRRNGNKYVGDCVYEMGNNDNCAEQGGSILAHTWIRCYTDACNVPWGIPKENGRSR